MIDREAGDGYFGVMKKILTISSALLIVLGLKAQKSNVQKETVKPSADSLVKASQIKAGSKAVGQQKDAKVAPVLKNTAAAKIAPVSIKAQKETPVKH